MKDERAVKHLVARGAASTAKEFSPMCALATFEDMSVRLITDGIVI
jgi:hypothetical protein